MKTLIFVRTHFIDDAIISEFKKLESSLTSNQHAVLFINNEHRVIDLKEACTHVINLQVDENYAIETLLYDKQLHDDLELSYYTTNNASNTGLDGIMWACCDYPFYAVYKEFDNYDYYWSLDYDVYCNGNSYSPFFKEYDILSDDLIIHDFRNVENESNWPWQYYSDWIYKDIPKYGGFFPVVRLSSKAIKFLYEKRLEHAKIFSQLKDFQQNKWIYGELFVPTELANNGFKCTDIPDQYLRFQPAYNLNRERIFEHPDFKLYHPVK